jgi:hypothetical protein
VATAARAAHCPAGGLVALHRRPALPNREPGRAGGVLPTASHRYAVEPARPADEAQITALARAHLPAEAVAVMRSGWDTMPSAFRVARDPDGSPAAFQCLCEVSSMSARLLAADPVAAAWREHLRANPVPRSQQVLFLRHMISRDPLCVRRVNRARIGSPGHHVVRVPRNALDTLVKLGQAELGSEKPRKFHLSAALCPEATPAARYPPVQHPPLGAARARPMLPAPGWDEPAVS